MIESILYILKEAIEHTLPLMPFIFLAFMFIEIIETKVVKSVKNKSKTNINPVTSASIGLIPHCGVGIIGSKLFSKKYITIGSLIAILISLSDEAIFMLLTHPQGITTGITIIIKIIIIKYIYAIVIGYLLDFIFKNKKSTNNKQKITFNANVCKTHKHGFDHSKDTKLQRYLIHPLKHAIPLIIFVFTINVLMDGVIYIVGEETFINLFNDIVVIQVLMAVLIGIIPNCVGSILLISLYIEGVLILPALIGGLVNQAGLSKIILLKENKNIKENIMIISILFISGLVLGYMLMLFI